VTQSGVGAGAPPVLVTGAPGWLGSRLVTVLQRGLAERPDLAPPAAPGSPGLRCLVAPGVDAASLAAPGVELVRGDLRDPAAAARLCAGAAGATLFHVAGVIHPRRRTRELFEVNAEGTRHVLDAAEREGVRRVVVVSSNSPVGVRRPGSPLLDEDSPCIPYLAYGASKRRAEEAARELHARGRVETVIVRLPWFYGPGHLDRQQRMFEMIRLGRFPVLGDGRQRRSMVYVDNACQGLLLAAATPSAAGRTYWIADERPYPFAEIVETIADVLAKDFGIAVSPRRLRVPAAAGRLAELADRALQAAGLYVAELHVLGELDKEIACSVARARAELGYAPRWALREGMREAIAWCRAQAGAA